MKLGDIVYSVLNEAEGEEEKKEERTYGFADNPATKESRIRGGENKAGSISEKVWKRIQENRDKWDIIRKKIETEPYYRDIIAPMLRDMRQFHNILGDLSKDENPFAKLLKGELEKLVDKNQKWGEESRWANIGKALEKVEKEATEISANLKKNIEAVLEAWGGKEESTVDAELKKAATGKSFDIGVVAREVSVENKEIENMLKTDEGKAKFTAAIGKIVKARENDFLFLQKILNDLKRGNAAADQLEKAQSIVNQVNKQGEENFKKIAQSLNGVIQGIRAAKADQEKKDKESGEAGTKDVSVKKLDIVDTYERVKAEIEEYKEYDEKEVLKGMTDKEKAELERAKKNAAKGGEYDDDEVDENYLFRTSKKVQFLKESTSYKGVNFEKNYYASLIIKSFVKDYETLGQGAVVFYEDTWGSWNGAFKIAAKEISVLREEISSFKDSLLLFEAPAALTAGAVSMGGVPSRASMLFRRASENLSSEGLTGVLGKVWSRIKDFGGFFKDKLMPFLKSGFEWAKQLATKGIEFFSGLGVGTALPIALAVAGVTSIAALRNRGKRKKLEALLKKNSKAREALNNDDMIEKALEDAKKLKKAA